MAGEVLLVLNAGSSSLKFSVFDAAPGRNADLLAKGQVEGIGSRPRLLASRNGAGTAVDLPPAAAPEAGHESALNHAVDWLRAQFQGATLAAVGHRVVHGGAEYAQPVRVDDEVLRRLEAYCILAPLHQPNNLAAIKAVRQRLPALPQVACFDTAFHRRHPAVADRFALPEALYAEGVRRYGFHGLSYEYILHTLPGVAPALAKKRLVVAHLGSGASMCAVRDGQSVDSTMGFTALDGLPMGTRCGAIDPGVLLYLIKAKGMDADAVERLLYQDSGLRGLSGVSNDVRDLLASDAPGARLALDCFVYRASRELGGLAAVMGGIDALIFTAGIGEKSAEIRRRICQAAAWLGLELDDRANEAGAPCITRPGSRVSAWVIPTNEERMIALHTMALMRQETAGAA
ncbi:MAG: acetate/propionate family kinase [Rhodospirillales bacterium]|nr:acetate/propionate family kinase [Rhodospirillales bacterium]